MAELIEITRFKGSEELLSAYERFVCENWKSRRHPERDADEMRQLFIMSTGLGGETGEVLEVLKKMVRDGKFDRFKLADELGDVLYYLTRIATWHGFTLDQIQVANMLKLRARRAAASDAEEK